MFYQLIQKKRDLWFQSSDCTVLYLVDYIYQRGMLRDAQIDAIKTYLFLKIACQASRFGNFLQKVNLMKLMLMQRKSMQRHVM